MLWATCGYLLRRPLNTVPSKRQRDRHRHGTCTCTCTGVRMGKQLAARLTRRRCRFRHCVGMQFGHSQRARIRDTRRQCERPQRQCHEGGGALGSVLRKVRHVGYTLLVLCATGCADRLRPLAVSVCALAHVSAHGLRVDPYLLGVSRESACGVGQRTDSSDCAQYRTAASARVNQQTRDIHAAMTWSPVSDER